jgi:hypothetical protein
MSAYPMMMWSGVRTSCDMLARKSVLALLASRVVSYNRVSSAVRSATFCSSMRAHSTLASPRCRSPRMRPTTCA